MQRRPTLVFILLLALPVPVFSQCTKQIILYLDVSGSMKPNIQGKDSPYWQTLNAVSMVLDEPDFLSQRDELKVITFGHALDPAETATGQSNIRKLVGRLQTQAKSDSFSNLGKVFEQVASQPFDGIRFERQLVIVASDFIHEPDDLPMAPNRPPSVYANHFAASFEASRDNLGQAFASPLVQVKERRLALFVAPAIGSVKNYGVVRDRIITELAATLGEELQSHGVGTGDDSTVSLVTAIRRAFLHDILVSTQTDAQNNSIQVEINNPNCSAVTVNDVRFQCLDAQSNDRGDAVRPISLNLPLRIEQTGLQTASVGLDQLTCPPGTRDYRVEVTTDEGPAGQGPASRRNVVEYLGNIASKEWFLTGTSLRAFVGLRGQTLEPEARYFAKVTVNSREVASGIFSAPSDLEMSNYKTYMLFFPSANSQILKQAESIRLEILDVGEAISKIDTSEPNMRLESLNHQVLERRINVILTGLGLLWVMGNLLVGRGRPRSGWGYMGVVMTLLMSAGSVAIIIQALRVFRPGIGSLISWSSLVQNMAFGLLLGVITFLAMRQYQYGRSGTRVLPVDLDDTEVDLDELEKQLHSLNRSLDHWKLPIRASTIVIILFPLLTMGIRRFQYEPLPTEQQQAKIIHVERTASP